jgi:hypothetical protein
MYTVSFAPVGFELAAGSVVFVVSVVAEVFVVSEVSVDMDL